MSVELELIEKSKRLEESECGDNGIAVDEMVSVGDGGAERWSCSRSGADSCWGCEVAELAELAAVSGIGGDEGGAAGAPGASGESANEDSGEEWDAFIIWRFFELLRPAVGFSSCRSMQRKR